LRCGEAGCGRAAVRGVAAGALFAVEVPRCRAHGGGKRCKWEDCTFSAQVRLASLGREMSCRVRARTERDVMKRSSSSYRDFDGRVQHTHPTLMFVFSRAEAAVALGCCGDRKSVV
jgi:hypothetical protein